MPSCLACARKLATTAAIWIERCARWTAGLAWKMHGRRGTNARRMHAPHFCQAAVGHGRDALLVRPSNDPKRITGCGEYTKTSVAPQLRRRTQRKAARERRQCGWNPVAGLRDHREITRERARSQSKMLCLRCARARDMGSNQKPWMAGEGSGSVRTRTAGGALRDLVLSTVEQHALIRLKDLNDVCRHGLAAKRIPREAQPTPAVACKAGCRLVR